MEEIWKDVVGYEGLYEVSNLGRIRRNGKILKPQKTRDGYLRVHLSKNGIAKHGKVHRLVALAFLPNPQNLPQINHKDEDKTNNAVNNLEWCSEEYNANYGTRNERVAEKNSKPVLQFDLQGNFIREWSNARKIEEELGIHYSSISVCCSGIQNTAGGYVWRFKE